ncbi:hypothetical protein DFA_10532 [Cavenderia fasciculata]|uniref:Uncharacterized protein n=1 Tax=Cavenderia fasciculata TaxID=261658 RepID=F4QAH1_CACFS|nr:uncharacterized protein DFA_10532 [Cavenderia fasciculata]EGG15690.1 hypothetical protein DFA_10532 [Cavenderia fasciculata]|eukprot:XP_004354432.1 hypothetical protein DFA_10532 [Cavenderia fasciculata]
MGNNINKTWIIEQDNITIRYEKGPHPNPLITVNNVMIPYFIENGQRRINQTFVFIVDNQTYRITYSKSVMHMGFNQRLIRNNIDVESREEFKEDNLALRSFSNGKTVVIPANKPFPPTYITTAATPTTPLHATYYQPPQLIYQAPYPQQQQKQQQPYQYEPLSQQPPPYQSSSSSYQLSQPSSNHSMVIDD